MPSHDQGLTQSSVTRPERPPSAWGGLPAMTDEVIRTVLNADLIAIDIGDAAELALTCEHLCSWLHDASHAVIDSLHSFGGADVQALIDTLDRLAGALSRAFPSVSPHRVTGTAALCPAETLSLAQFLLGIAGNGWPEDHIEARTLRDDCRGWALRLARTPAPLP
jgi:hypothetical protein